MRVYVMCSFAHKEEARIMQRLLQGRGHKITHDWTYETVGNLEGLALRNYLAMAARDDLHGVSRAQAVVLLHFPENRMTLVEFGWALRDPEMIVVVVDGDRDYHEVPIAYFFDRVKHVKTQDEAADYLTEREALDKIVP